MQKKSKRSDSASAQKVQNSAARLMAVQAVYQILETDQSPEKVIEEYLAHRTGMEVEGKQMVKPDPDLFKILVEGVTQKKADLDAVVALKLTPKNEAKMDRIEPLLRSIILCGAYELLEHQHIDFPIIISNYLDVTHAFYDQREAAFVNGILDSINGHDYRK